MAKGWVQAVLLVGIFGFTVLGYMAARTYQAEPPIPDRVVSASGEELFSGEDVRSGQEVFLRNGLMQYGFTWDSRSGHKQSFSGDRTCSSGRGERSRTSERERCRWGGHGAWDAGHDERARRP